MSDDDVLTAKQIQSLNEENPNWAYDMCCGNCTGGTCYVDVMTGA